MPDTTANPVTAYLAEVRERITDRGYEPEAGSVIMTLGLDAERLVAAVEAVLRLAGEWSKSAADLDGMAERSAARGAAGFRVEQLAASAQAHRYCADALEASVTAALLREGESSG